jgi:hypothetical protein
MQNPAEDLVGRTAGFVPSGQQEGRHLMLPISGGSRDSVKKDPAEGLVRACPAELGGVVLQDICQTSAA